MQRFLVTLRSHATGAADEFFVDARESSPVAAIREAVRVCSSLGPFAVMQAVPWPKGFRSADDAARKLAAAG